MPAKQPPFKVLRKRIEDILESRRSQYCVGSDRIDQGGFYVEKVGRGRKAVWNMRAKYTLSGDFQLIATFHSEKMALFALRATEFYLPAIMLGLTLAAAVKEPDEKMVKYLDDWEHRNGGWVRWILQSGGNEVGRANAEKRVARLTPKQRSALDAYARHESSNWKLRLLNDAMYGFLKDPVLTRLIGGDITSAALMLKAYKPGRKP